MNLPTDLNETATRSWYAWKAHHAASAEDPRTVAIAMYGRGWRDCFFASVDLADLRPVLLRWVELLETERIERDASALEVAF